MKKAFVLVLSLLLTQIIFANQFKYKNIIYEQQDEEITLVKYRGIDAELSIPKALNKIPVTKLGKRAFAENNYIEEITLPSTITSISEEAFANCKNLSTVYYYAEDLKIEKNAFLNCNNISLIPVAVSDKTSSPRKTKASYTKTAAVSSENDTQTETELPVIPEETPADPFEDDPEIVELRSEYIDTSLTFARILEKAIPHYDVENDDLPIEYVTEIYTYLEVFMNSADLFHAAVGNKYGTDEVESGAPEHLQKWMPEAEMFTLFSYLNRIDRVMLKMGLNTPANSFEQTARLYYNYHN